MIEKNSLLKYQDTIIRVLEIRDEHVLMINCIQKTMPQWREKEKLINYTSCTEDELLSITDTKQCDVDMLSAERRKVMHERYTMIAGVLTYVGDEKQRSHIISKISVDHNKSKQTIRNYLCLYLVYQNIGVLAPKERTQEKELTQDEKNMRWALNKFYYTKNKNSLNTAYTLMLKEKYCDDCGVLLPDYPTVYQFKYFHRKHMKLETYYISRDGIKNYQRNNRPLLGDGVQEFAPNIGTAMLDSTICDIYLVNESGNLVGRPILTACIDAYSSLCCGYSLSWEGGVYSLRNLLVNVITDKTEWCSKFGISVKPETWNCSCLPAILVTDMGAEYKSMNFEQLTELGAKIINLPSFRPELKGSVEKFFDLIQSLFKKYLKGKGVIEPDYQERGSHDYRKDACLTMFEFEKILLHCIIYYNSKRIIEHFPYTEDMITANVQPYASDIWNYGMALTGANLISINPNELMLTLLPRTVGKFGRNGLKVNKLRYKHKDYTEMYLRGKMVTVAYNPDDVSEVWLIENGKYICFQLIENRFKGQDLSKVYSIKNTQKDIVKAAKGDNYQAQIQLAEHIEAIANSVIVYGDTNIKEVRNTRTKERIRAHIDIKGGVMDV